jgi:hypothetical protein
MRSRSANRDLILSRIENEYLTDPERRSVEYWQQFAAEVSLGDLRDYATSQRWEARRASYWKGVQAAWLKVQTAETLATRHLELKQVLELRSDIFRLLQPRQTEEGTVAPYEVHSYEGLITAFVRLDQMAEVKREAFARMAVPMLEEAEAGREPVKPALPLDGQEIRAMAHHLLKLRRVKRRQALGIPQEPGEEHEDLG